MKRKARNGFTLIELLVVIAIIAIISGAVVTLNSGLSTKSAVEMTYATEKQLTKQIATYVQGNGGLMPDGFDSLIRDDYATAGSSAGYTQTGPLQLINSPKGVIYAGYDVNPLDGTNDTGAVSLGLASALWTGWMHSFTFAKLTAQDLAYLSSLGITYVYDIDHATDMVNGELTRKKRFLAVGDPVAVLDPTGVNYLSAFSCFTDTTDQSGVQMTGATLLNNRPHFIVFGLGPLCTMVGKRNGGLQEAPVCSTIVAGNSAKASAGNGYYDRYMVVVKMPLNNDDQPGFVGVLDSNGWTIKTGRQWYPRSMD